MQKIFDDQLPPEPEFYLERLKKPGTMPAPEGGFPRFDGYDVVSVRVREATITATNRSGDAVIEDVQPLPYVQTVDTRSYNTNPTITPAMTMPAPAAAPAPMPMLMPPVKPGLRGRDIAIWICVAQLGVIIWCLLGPMMQQQKNANTTVLFRTASAWPAEFGKAFNSAKANVIAQVAHVAPHATPSVKKPPKGGKKPYAHKGFVPPPPPEMASNSRMMVPPPPVAYRLPPMPGAAAASTLVAPPPAVEKHEPVIAARQGEDVLTPNTVPSSAGRRAAVVAPTVSIASEPQEHEAGTDPASEVVPTPAPVEQSSPFRRVMNGNRTRTIVDR